MYNSIFATLNRIKLFKQSRKQNVKFFSYKRADKEEVLLPEGMQFVKIDNDNKFSDFLKKYYFTCDYDFAQRFKEKSIFYAIVDGTNCIVTGWLTFRQPFWISEIDSFIDASDSNWAILYDYVTESKYRGHGWYGKLLKLIINEFDSADKFIIYTLEDNNSSQRGLLKAGFEEDGMYNRLTVKQFLDSKNFVLLGSKYRFGGIFYKKY